MSEPAYPRSTPSSRLRAVRGMCGRSWEHRCEIADGWASGRAVAAVRRCRTRCPQVFHRDSVVVEAFGVQGTDELGTETGQAARLRADTLPEHLDRNRAAATDTDIEMQPVLGCLVLRYHLEPDPRPPAGGIDDAVSASAQLFLGHPDIAPVRIPAGEAIGRRFKHASQ